MKKKFILVIFASLFFCCNYGLAQYKYEREFRIRKSQFPPDALVLIKDNVQELKRLKFYQETDSTRVSFEAKFKKDKLRYSIEFNSDGVLEGIEILIQPIDIPNDTYTNIESYLNNTFSKYRIKLLKQQYCSNNDSLEKTFKNAFQNLILPSINYEVIVIGKKDKGYSDYEILFDAEGNLKSIKTSLPSNYNHVLY
ncbi:hypothetical protein [Maribacter sp. ACAM166]|uniref:hypothetical protein n=1 Tax=Maribacter sp. ACAM166 TaxID=2508996 RepID=UPI0010FD7E11|nr:hypothetical protein [Maribacter sp. ACAM166]TLP82612.1 hypothetical protein ES765_00130 [Maribacter sp. ACAM166]